MINEVFFVKPKSKSLSEHTPRPSLRKALQVFWVAQTEWQKQAFHLGSFELVTLQSESDKYSKNIPIVGTHYDKDLEWAKSWDFGNPNLFC